MENASKALLMAGGILIGIMILSIFAYEMVHVSSTGTAYQEQIEKTRIQEFNSQFEIYLNRELKAQDVATIYNLVQEWNYGGEGNPTDIISIEFAVNYELKTFFNDIEKGNKTIEEFLVTYPKNCPQTDRYYYYFKCPSIEYSKKNGRVESLKIELKRTLL